MNKPCRETLQNPYQSTPKMLRQSLSYQQLTHHNIYAAQPHKKPQTFKLSKPGQKSAI